MKLDEDRSESGLTWGFEIESLVMGILGDAEEIEEKVVLDLLMNQVELKSLLKTFENSHIKKMDGSFRTVRDELDFLLQDVANGNWHASWENAQGEGRKLSRWTVKSGNTEYVVYKRTNDETNALKK